tara:strand:- start:366 stop:590 length:225 start_codon:yes stop_codon:yes gene_type:complete
MTIRYTVATFVSDATSEVLRLSVSVAIVMARLPFQSPVSSQTIKEAGLFHRATREPKSPEATCQILWRESPVLL